MGLEDRHKEKYTERDIQGDRHHVFPYCRANGINDKIEYQQQDRAKDRLPTPVPGAPGQHQVNENYGQEQGSEPYHGQQAFVAQATMRQSAARRRLRA